MSSYDRKVAQLEAHARFLNGQMAQLVAEGEALVSLHHALRIAFRERVGREYVDVEDEFSDEDERRADELLLVLFPEDGA
jgi:hypothetical protein